MTEKSNWNFIIPEETPENLTLKIHQPNWYKVDVEKLQQSSMKEASYLFASLLVAENYEYFDKVKKFLLDVPEPRKSLEELSQELDEKFEKHIESVKDKFALSKETAEYHYNRKFETINGNFEYARENGFFPLKYTLSGAFDCSTLSVNGGVNIGSPTFMVKNGSNHQGYYTIGEDGYYKFYMEKKPNRVFRFFVYKLMGFKWNDEVLK
jgi:hypothetical protein